MLRQKSRSATKQQGKQCSTTEHQNVTVRQNSKSLWGQVTPQMGGSVTPQLTRWTRQTHVPYLLLNGLAGVLLLFLRPGGRVSDPLSWPMYPTCCWMVWPECSSCSWDQVGGAGTPKLTHVPYLLLNGLAGVLLLFLRPGGRGRDPEADRTCSGFTSSGTQLICRQKVIVYK